MSSLIQTAIDSNLIQVLMCTGVAFILGIIIMAVYRVTDEHPEKNLSIALLVLPVVVTALISAVNGNLGTGIAIMGVFALVRFRAKPTNARSIIFILFDMSVGVICASGYLLFAVIFVIFVCLILTALRLLRFGQSSDYVKRLKVTIPENLDYAELFNDIFTKYTTKWKLLGVKTTNLGALYEIRYEITLKKGVNEKEMMDEIRIRNGNLQVVLNRYDFEVETD